MLQFHPQCARHYLSRLWLKSSSSFWFWSFGIGEIKTREMWTMRGCFTNVHSNSHVKCGKVQLWRCRGSISGRQVGRTMKIYGFLAAAGCIQNRPVKNQQWANMGWHSRGLNHGGLKISRYCFLGFGAFNFLNEMVLNDLSHLYLQKKCNKICFVLLIW